MSHAKPNRGWKWFSVLASERFGPSLPPCRPASAQAVDPGGTSMPLQASAPSEATNAVGSKLEIVSPRSSGFSKRDHRRP
jgi:hypothetical protein